MFDLSLGFVLFGCVDIGFGPDVADFKFSYESPAVVFSQIVQYEDTVYVLLCNKIVHTVSCS